MNAEVEQIRIIRGLYEGKLKNLNKEIDELKFKNQQLHYAFKGILGEKLTVHIELSPVILENLSEYKLAQKISSNAMEMAYAEIEKRLGDRYALQKQNMKLLEHINRLERQFGIPSLESWMVE